MLKTNQKSKILFSMILFSGIFAISVFVVLSYMFVDKIPLLWMSLLGKLKTICGCENHLSFFNHPYIFLSSGFFIASFISFFAFSLVKFIKIKKSTKEFIRLNLQTKKSRYSTKLNNALNSLQITEDIVEIRSKDLVVFCFGIFKPKICISDRLINKLKEDELKAVLLHEQHHLMSKDPLKFYFANLAEKTLFFIPGIHYLAKRFITYSEVAADEWAIYKLKEKKSLATAVFKILEWNERNIINGGLAITFFDTVTEERVKKIINDKHTLKINFFSFKYLLSTAFFVLVMISYIFSAYSIETVLAKHSNGTCSEFNPNSIFECAMKSENGSCSMSLNNNHNISGIIKNNEYYCGKSNPIK